MFANWSLSKVEKTVEGSIQMTDIKSSDTRRSILYHVMCLVEEIAFTQGQPRDLPFQEVFLTSV